MPDRAEERTRNRTPHSSFLIYSGERNNDDMKIPNQIRFNVMLSSDDIDMGSIAFDDGSGDTLGPSRLGLVAVSALWGEERKNAIFKKAELTLMSINYVINCSPAMFQAYN